MLVSVIIPTYNRADKVAAAIASVKKQTYRKTQIIVVDDGSTDNTKEIVAQFSGVEYFYQDNQRQAAARTAGLKLAKGELISTLDSDDVWDDDFLEKNVECLKRHDLDFVFSSWRAERTGKILPGAWEISKIWQGYVNNPRGNWFLLSAAETRDMFIRTCPAPSSSLLIRKSSIASDWNSRLLIADDWCFILDMAIAKPCRAAFTLERNWTKNIHEGNIYDGRNRGEIASELEIHDTRVMKRLYSNQLSFGEKLILNRRIIRGYIVKTLFFARDRFGLRNPQRIFRSKLETAKMAEKQI